MKYVEIIKSKFNTQIISIENILTVYEIGYEVIIEYPAKTIRIGFVSKDDATKYQKEAYDKISNILRGM